MPRQGDTIRLKKVDGDKIIIIDTLEGESMDLEEFQASIDAIGLAVAQHYKKLSAYRD